MLSTSVIIFIGLILVRIGMAISRWCQRNRCIDKLDKYFFGDKDK